MSTRKTITYLGTTYTCSLYDRFRPHTPDELERLRESLQVGVHADAPVLVYDDADLGLLCVLDGVGRLTLAAELGIDFPVKHLGTMTTEEAYGQALQRNDARRHDDPEAIRRRRVERVRHKREVEHKSTRVISDEVGVSKSQVDRDLKVAEVSREGTPDPEPTASPTTEVTPDDGPPPAPPTVKGRDGKKYPAKRKSAKQKKDDAGESIARALRSRPHRTDESVAEEVECEPKEVRSVRKRLERQRPEEGGPGGFPRLSDKPPQAWPALEGREVFDEAIEHLAAAGFLLHLITRIPAGEHLRLFTDRDNSLVRDGRIRYRRPATAYNCETVEEEAFVAPALGDLTRLLEATKPAGELCGGCGGKGCESCAWIGLSASEPDYAPKSKDQAGPLDSTKMKWIRGKFTDMLRAATTPDPKAEPAGVA